MKTHENRPLFSRALLRATTCLFFAAGASAVPTLAATDTGTAGIAIVQQQQTVNGTVTDANGDPIIGASVVVKGNTANGTITDIDGKFSLNVPKNAILVVSFVGYKTTEVPAGKGLKSTL